MIEHATEQDRPALISLWQEAFGEARFARLFFDDPELSRETLVDRRDGSITAMLNLLPCTYCGAHRGAYLYALATGTAYRRQGRMAALLQEAIRLGADRQYGFLYLIPAGEALKQYYRGFGFTAEAAAGCRENLVFSSSVQQYVLRELAEEQVPDPAGDRLMQFSAGKTEHGLFYLYDPALKKEKQLKVYGYIPY